MTTDRRRAFGDLALCAAVTAGAVVLLIGAADLPPPRFDPLGSAALPRFLAALMLFFGAIIAVRAIRRLRADAAAGATAPEPLAADAPGTVYPMRSVAVFVALVAYVAALDIFRVPLIPASTVFMGCVGFVITGNSLKYGAIYAVFGLVLAILLSWVMANFLYVRFG